MVASPFLGNAIKHNCHSHSFLDSLLMIPFFWLGSQLGCSVLLAWPKRTKRSRLHRLGYSALLRAGNGWNSLRSNSIHFFSALRVAPLNAHPLRPVPFADFGLFLLYGWSLLFALMCSCSKAGSFLSSSLEAALFGHIAAYPSLNPSCWFRSVRALRLVLFPAKGCSWFETVPDCRIRTCFIPRLTFVTHLIFILTLWHFDILTQFGCEANSCFLIIACFWAKDSSLLPRYKLALPDENLSILIFANSINSDRFLMGYLRQIDYVCLREFIQLIYKPIHS